MRGARGLLPLAGAVALAATGCFGEGPDVEEPAGATILYANPPAPSSSFCSASTYIGDVAIVQDPIAGDRGYFMVEPFRPQSGSCSGNDGGGGSANAHAIKVMSFRLDGSQIVEQVAEAGQSDGGRPQHLAAAGNGQLVWAFLPNSSDPGIQIANLTDVQNKSFTPPGGSWVADLVADGDSLWMATWNVGNTPGSGARANPRSPLYPCCSESAPPTDGFRLVTAPVTPGGVTEEAPQPHWGCQDMPHCLVQNTTSLFAMTRGSADATVTRFAKADLASSTVAEIGFGSGGRLIAPVGLAANDSFAAWTLGPAYQANNSSDLLATVPYCSVNVLDLGAPSGTMPTELLNTSEFSCLDALVLDGFVYFTIVAPTGQHVRGLGIGRISVDGHTFESIATGTEGDATGPRRLLAHQGDLIVVDPFTIARIAASKLADRHDFDPGP